MKGDGEMEKGIRQEIRKIGYVRGLKARNGIRRAGVWSHPKPSLSELLVSSSSSLQLAVASLWANGE